jgi:hypothetical protein
MTIDDFTGRWRIASSNSAILEDGGSLVITANSPTRAAVAIQNPGRKQEPLGESDLTQDRLLISSLAIGSSTYHFEAVLVDDSRSANRILYGILFRLSGLPAGDDGATGVWGADEEAPLDNEEVC